MTSAVTFYHNPMSRARTVHWMLEEVGAPYEVKLVDFQKREHKKPSFLAINPMGKLPTIAHMGTIVTESAAICTYLADAFPKNQLAPRIDDPQRGAYYRWLFFGASCVEPAVIDGLLKRPSSERTSTVGYGTLEDTLNTLELALKSGPYLLGNQFTAADVYMAGQIGFGMILTKVIEPRPIFQSYLARCTDRPAYKRSMEQLDLIDKKMKAAGA